MPIQCPICSKVNPSDAAYCYYDGRALAEGSQAGPLRLGTLPFPIPFCFADGRSCANFNQLALACDERWNEARNLLAQGFWQSFFSGLGRLDLAAVAGRAAKEPDLDVGLTHLLESLPADADALRPPKLGVLAAEEDLGTLEPGKDHKFELQIANQGMLVLRGMVKTDCDWLCFGERAGGPSLKMFGTRSTYTLPVRVLGNKLRAGRKPLEGQIVIDTNGGCITLPVRANVPIRAFPKGQYANDVLAGARSPHDVAVKAKAHPQEAAILFEQGAVKAWYASNGWIYPIQGTVGTGKGAVQQFFEALGLTKPPRLEISTERILCKGKVGQQLTKQVTISTKESRFVYAQAWSKQDWIQAGPTESHGNTVTIPLRIEVPARPGETLHTEVTFQGNGQQQFVVPVTLAVAASNPHADAEPEKAAGRLPLGWLCAALALFLILTAGVLALIRSRRGEEAATPPIVYHDLQPPPPSAPHNEAWWDRLPDNKLAAEAAALKESAPEEGALVDGLAAQSDVERYKPYEQLAAKLPELVRNPKAREPLGRFVTDCCVYEPSELAIAPLRRSLASQLPQSGVAFRPEDKGGELERAFFALQVVLNALKNKAIRPERAQNLVNDLGSVFGLDLDTSASADELREQTEKLLAVRCYRNTLPTASQSIEYALTIRAELLEKCPQYLSAGFRQKIDLGLIEAGLSKSSEAWPRLEPIVKTCLESNDLAIVLKIVDLYGQANSELAQKMEPVLAAKWKAADNPKLTRADKVAAIRKSLVSAKISPAERLAQLQQLSDRALAGVKPREKKATVLLQDTVRLAHASTMACILFHKDAEVERFDELVAKVPEIEPIEPTEAKPAEETPKQPAAKEVIVLGAQPKIIRGQLTLESERDPTRDKAFCKVYTVSMKAGQFYTIQMVSKAFNPYLRLETPDGNQQVAEGESGGVPIASILFVAQMDGTHRIIATASRNGARGAYTLQIQQAGGLSARGFGVPRFLPNGKLVPGVFIGPGFPVPEAPKAGKEKDKQWSASDVDALGSSQGAVRVAAFNSLAGTAPSDLARQQAPKIARYLLVTIQQKSELEDVTSKLDSFATCRPLLLALADDASNDPEVTPQRAEAIVAGVLGQQVRFASDEDWRPACTKLLLQRVLDLTGTAKTATTTTGGADQAAEILRDLYKEQAMVLGMEDPEFLALTRPSQVLEGVVQHVAAKAATQHPAPADQAVLAQIGRQLQVARFIAANDLEHMVLLQRLWIKVLTIYLRGQAPAKAEGFLKIQEDLAEQDRGSQNVLDQLRAGEEKILRLWALADNLQ